MPFTSDEDRKKYQREWTKAKRRKNRLWAKEADRRSKERAKERERTNPDFRRDRRAKEIARDPAHYAARLREGFQRAKERPYYARRLLADQIGIKPLDVPLALAEAKVAQLKVLRAIKQK